MPKTRRILTTAEIVEHFGGATKLAGLLGCTPQNVSKWLEFEVLPHKQAYALVELSRGKWTHEQMPVRPARVTAAA